MKAGRHARVPGPMCFPEAASYAAVLPADSQ